MRNSMLHGSQRVQDRIIACLVKPNGNMQPAPEPAAAIGGATRSSRRWLTAKAAANPMIHASPRLWAAFRQIHWGFTTWPVASRNGSRIAGTRTIRAHRPTDRLGLRQIVGRECCVAVLGATMRAMPDLRAELITTAACDTRPMDSGQLGRFERETLDACDHPTGC